MSLNSRKVRNWLGRHLPHLSQSGRALAIALIYLVLGFLWIFVTDRLVFHLDDEWFSFEENVSTLKGLLFVSLSALVVYLLTSGLYGRIIRQSAELRAVFSQPNLGSLQFDSTGRIHAFSPCVSELLGMSEADLRRHKLEDLAHPDDRQKIRDLIGEFASGGRDHDSIAYRMQTTDGESRWVEKHIRLLDRHGRFCRFVSTVQWIDERVEAQENLREALREKEALINSTDDLIWSVDSDMRLVSFNRPYADIIQELSGIAIERGMSVVMPVFGEELVKRWQGYYQRAIDGETFSVLEENRQETGQYYSEVLLSPIREENSIVGVSCIARNVTELQRARMELEERTQRLQTAQRIAYLGDWTYDDNNGQLTWSDEMYRIMEQDPQDGPVSVEDLLTTYLPQADSERLAQAIQSATVHATPYDLELTLTLPSGTEKIIRAVGVPKKQTNGHYSLQGIVQDITTRARLERELSRHRDHLKAVIDNLPGVLFQYQRFPDGRDQIIYQSEGSEEIWGLTPEEVMAENQRVWEQVDKRDLPKLMESIETSRKELSAWNHIWRTHHPDGNLYWHEGFGIPEKQEDGSVLWNSIILNVTDRVVAQTKLHEKEEYWEMLTRHASDGIAICNAEGELVFFNETMRSWQGDMDASLKPEEWAEAYGLYTLDGSRLLSPDEIELCRALQGETVTNFRHSVKTPGKPLRYVESSGGPLYDNAGNQIGAMVLVRDITDRYQREYEITNAVIEAAERERERISAELHDSVAQELSIVSLNLNNYQLENPAAAESIRLLKARAYLEKALDETRSISHRMVPGTVRDLGLAGAVRELVEDLNTSGSTEIAFTCNFNTRLEPLQELDLFRIIQEALHNVIRHAGALLAAVDIRRKGDELEVTISDNGRGFRGTQASSKKLGIGLRTMRNRTLKWGGDLKIQSDQGSTIVHAVIPIKEAS